MLGGTYPRSQTTGIFTSSFWLHTPNGDILSRCGGVGLPVVRVLQVKQVTQVLEMGNAAFFLQITEQLIGA